MGLLAGYCSQVWSLAFTGFKVGNRSNMNQNIISPAEAWYWVEAFPKLLGCRVQEPGPGLLDTSKAGSPCQAEGTCVFFSGCSSDEVAPLKHIP